MASLRWLLIGAPCLLLSVAAQAQPSTPTPRILTATPSSEAGRKALAAADAELADPVAEARRTLGKPRKRFQAGLAADEECLLTVRVVEGDTLFRPVACRVIGWRDGTVQALLPLVAHSSSEPTAAEKIPVSFPESAVLDWMILRTDGREEGNYVGRYFDTAQQMQAFRLR